MSSTPSTSVAASASPTAAAPASSVVPSAAPAPVTPVPESFISKPADVTAAPVAPTEPQKGFIDKPAAEGDKEPSKPTTEAPIAPTGAPEKYEEFKLPEGVQIDKGLMEEALKDFKELNLSQAAAQKLVDRQIAITKAQAEVQQNAAKQLLDNDWKRIVADPEMGGANLMAAKAQSQKAYEHIYRKLDAPAQAAMDQLMIGAGVGSTYPMAKFLHEVSKLISEDRFVPDNTVSATKDNRSSGDPIADIRAALQVEANKKNKR